MNGTVIRSAKPEDYSRILEIYSIARDFMREAGNPTQWADSWPPENLISEDISIGRNYVVEIDGEVKAVFAFIIGDDPTYGVIEDGAWRSSSSYGTIHRIASDGSVKGIAGMCFDFCLGKINYLRIDTHADNIPMQRAVKRYGFERCGIIYVADGSPRIAFDYIP